MRSPPWILHRLSWAPRETSMRWKASRWAWRNCSKLNNICGRKLSSEWIFAILTRQLAVFWMISFHKLVIGPRNSITAGRRRVNLASGLTLESAWKAQTAKNHGPGLQSSAQGSPPHAAPSPPPSPTPWPLHNLHPRGAFLGTESWRKTLI